MKKQTLLILLMLSVFLVGVSSVSAENMDEIGNFSSSDVTDDVISLDDDVGDTTSSVENDVSTSSVDDEVISDGEPAQSDYTWGDFKSEVENTSINTVELNRGNIAPSTSSSNQININLNKNDDLLSTNSENLLSDSYNHIYVSESGTGDGSSAENPTTIDKAITSNINSNTVVHILDGNYTVKAVTLNNKNNIIIQAENYGKVNIKAINNAFLTFGASFGSSKSNNFVLKGINFEYSKSIVYFNGATSVSGYNVTIENCSFNALNEAAPALNLVNVAEKINIINCIFTGSSSESLIKYTYAMGNSEFNLNNCVFENITITKASSYPLYFNGGSNKNRVTSIFNLEKCKFTNMASSSNINGIYSKSTTTSDDNIYQFYVSNCTFDSDDNKLAIYNEGKAQFSFENNSISSDYAIQLNDKTAVISPLTFRILNNESVGVCVNESVDIIGELVDDMGNRIYHAGLKLDVNDSDRTPVINSTTGLYVLSFIPENIGELPIGVKCSNIYELDSDVFYLTVKCNPQLTVNCTNASYGEIFNVNATLKEDVSSENVIFTIFDSNGEIVKTAEGKIDNGFASAEFEGLNVGEYIVEVASIEDENYVSSSKTMSFNITQANATVDLSILNDGKVCVGDSIIVQAVLPTNASGSVTFRLKGTQQIITVSGETATALFAGLSEGNYTVYATYSGDTNYNPSEEFNTTFTVYKKDSEFYIYASDVSLGETAYVYAYLPSDATGNITYYIEGSTPETLDVNEEYSISGLVVGKYCVRAVYSGDSNYNGSEYTCTFEVTYDLELENDEFGYGDDAVVNITFPENVNGNLGIIVDNNYSSPISASVVNGSAVFNLPSNLAPGEHTLALTFQGETHIETNVTITVVPKITSLDDLTTGDNTISLSLPSDATGNLTIRVDDEDSIVIPVVNGTASYDLNNLSAGEHEIYVAYEGNYPEFSDYKTVDVAKATPKSTINAPSSITAGKAVTVPINLPSDATGVVLVDVDGKKYYADVVKGVANVAIPSLTAGDKKLTYRYLGDDKYAPVTGSATLKVTNPPAPTPKKDVVKLTLKKVKVKKSAKKLVITATLKINGKAVKGKKITFKFNKKTYTAKTNKKGVAKITVKKAVLKKLKVGKKVTYTAKYGKTTVKKSVKVKK